MRTEPIIIDDDEDDLDLLKEIFTKLNYENQVKYFQNGYLALEFILRTDEKPLVVISDINMPKLNGFELRDKFLTHSSTKIQNIPFIFLTTAFSEKIIEKAYALSPQGFFIKPSNILDLEKIIRQIVDYWNNCKFLCSGW